MHQHQQQLDADEQHADAHAGAQRDGIDRERLAAQAGERRARVREGIHANAEPGHAVAASDADEREDQDDRQRHRDGLVGNRRQPAEVGRDDHGDERPEDQDEAALSGEVGLARLVNELGHLEHRTVHREVLELIEGHQPEEQPKGAHQQPAHQKRVPVNAHEADRRQVGYNERGLAATMHGCCLRSRWLRLRGQHELRDQTKHTDERRHQNQAD